jgi:hypothetical protein
LCWYASKKQERNIKTKQKEIKEKLKNKINLSNMVSWLLFFLVKEKLMTIKRKRDFFVFRGRNGEGEKRDYYYLQEE